MSCTITVNGLEHGLKSYNYDVGYGVTQCGAMVGPWDLGPNDGNEVKCVDCKAKLTTTQGKS